MTTALEVHGLGYAYPDGNQALFEVDLTVWPGERVALLGPNGAGKTTLALHLNGVLRPETGWITVGGVPLHESDLRAIRKLVGILFQDPDDQLFMPSVRADVAFGPANLGFRGRHLEERVAAALAAVGMLGYEDRPPHHLSYGQRRRVALATVLAMEPEVLVLDEPTSNLDPAGRRELVAILRSLELTMIVITHDLPFALELCPRAVVMNSGVVVADGATRSLLANAEMMARNRLDLPFGFDPSLAFPR